MPGRPASWQAALLAATLAVGLAATAAAADTDRGKALYDARCDGCHDTSVHNRKARRALDVDGIKAQVLGWDAYLGGGWREAEVNDVTAYLNELYYKYPCPPGICPQRQGSMRPPNPNPSPRG